MKHRLFLIIATLVGLGSITTSCSWDDELVVANNDGDQKTPISFNVNIGSLPDPEVTTRSNDPLGADVSKATRGASKDYTVAGYTFKSGNKICVAVTGNGLTSRSQTEDPKLYTVAAGDAGSTGSAKTLTYAGATATDAFDWLSKTETVSMRAWCWGTDNTTTNDPDNAVFSIKTGTVESIDYSTQSGDDVKELLYSPSKDYTWTDANSDDKPDDVNIILYHQMARIVVNVSSTITTGVSITGVQIGHSDNKIPLSGKYSKPTSGNFGTWDVTTTTPTTGIINAKHESGGYYSAVIVPYNGSQSTPDYYKADDKFIVITTNQGTYCYSIPNKDGETTINGLNFQPGKQYTFNITDLNQIDFNVTVSAWDNGGSEPSATNLTFSE